MLLQVPHLETTRSPLWNRHTFIENREMTSLFLSATPSTRVRAGAFDFHHTASLATANGEYEYPPNGFIVYRDAYA